jgi:hypothetical protein
VTAEGDKRSCDSRPDHVIKRVTAGGAKRRCDSWIIVTTVIRQHNEEKTGGQVKWGRERTEMRLRNRFCIYYGNYVIVLCMSLSPVMIADVQVHNQ